MDRIVMRAGRALVGASAGDDWPQVREAVMALWPDGSGPPQAGRVDVGAELDGLREQVLRARGENDRDTEKALEGAWQLKFQQLLSANPAVSPGLILLGQAESDPGGSQDADGKRLAVSTAVIGQAAAGLTAIAAIIYGSGALTIALRLFFTHLSWEAVLGQLPHDVILTTGFGQIVLPSLIVGMLGAVLLNFLVNGEHEPLVKPIQLMLQRYLTAEPSIGHFLAWLFTAAFFGALEAIISLPFYVSHAHSYFNPGVVIPTFDALLVSAVISALTVSITLIMLPSPTVDGLRHGLGPWALSKRQKPPKSSSLNTTAWMIWTGTLIAFAAIPGIATFSAVTLFPPSKACSTQFLNGRLEGNLIATNGGWAYMVEYENTSPVQDFIAVVPLSSLQMQTIGHAGTCGNLLSNPVNQPSPTPSPSPSNT